MRLIVLSLIALLPLVAASQGPAAGSDVLRQKIDTFNSGIAQEKLFVHTDRSLYLAGEIVWFKIYCVAADSHLPMTLSKIAYVEILDKDDHAVLQGKITLDQAEGKGSFYLPLSLTSGNYKLRAYTNWMKNFGPDCFFEEVLTILNTLKDQQPASTAVQAPDTPLIDAGREIVFFPEGGDLVDALPSVMAFRATDGKGAGRDCKGSVVDEKGNTVTTFISLHCGIGRFFFTPSATHHYYGIVEFSGGRQIKKELPVALAQGYVMTVNDDKVNRLRITVHARLPWSSRISLVGWSGQHFRLARQKDLAGDSAVFFIDKDSLGEGVNTLTLFDGAYRPVCERLTFRRPSRQLIIGLSADSISYGLRSKVGLGISVSPGDSLGEAPQASLSLSVYRLDSLQGQVGSGRSSSGIMEYLWLGSDLKGHVDSIDYYFTAYGDTADQALDNLMLTHGWRRLRWAGPLRSQRTAPPFPPEYNGHLITCRLTDMQSNVPLPGRSAFISAPGRNFRFCAGLTDSAGRITVDMKDYFGTSGLFVHSGSPADSPCKVDVLSPFIEQYGGDRLPRFSYVGYARHSLLDRSMAMQAQNIYTGGLLQRFRASAADSLAFFGVPDHIYMLDDYTRFTTMEEVLREYVHEVDVNRSAGKLHVLMMDERNRSFFEDNILLLLDGIPLTDEKLFSYDPLKVKKLEIVSGKYFMGPDFFNGIASFTTYKGDFEGLEPDRQTILVDYEGLQMQREFYSPVYETPQQKAARLPDLRHLLSWSPDIHTDGLRTQELGFYTSDLPGSYLVVVQGISSDGRIGYKETHIRVRRP